MCLLPDMGEDSDGGNPVELAKKRKKLDKPNNKDNDYKIYRKTNYKRLFSENHTGECVVFVESTEQEKVGNKNPLTLTKLFTDNVKAIVGVHRVNAYKIGVTFKKPAPANNFLKMDTFLNRHKLKAFIPAFLTEVTGIIRHVPTNMSNEDIYKNMSCDQEIISVKRFMRKVDGKLTPLGTIAVTFAATVLPQYAYLQLFRYPVHTYIPPVLQCYKCLKFNHSAKVCRGQQMCSSCAGQHSFRECDVEGIVCINCSGNHLAISRDCPVKQKKVEEKKNKYINRSYADVMGMPYTLNNKSFPPLRNNTQPPPHTNDSVNKPDRALNAEQIVSNDIVINALVKTLVTLGNSKDNVTITNARIKEILLANLI